MDPISWDALKKRGQIINLADINLDEDYFVLGHHDNRRREYQWTDYPLYLVKASDVLNPTSLYNNPLDFYLDGNAPAGGDGSFQQPFNTITQLNNAALALGPTLQYTGYVLPYAPGYGAEVIGTLALATNLSLIGVTAINTTINCLISLTALPAYGVVSQFTNLAFNNVFTINMTSAPFAYISIVNGQININRVDTNSAATVILNGGILGSTISGGTVIIKDGLIFGNINISGGATVYCSATLMQGAIFDLTGTCTLKTLSTYNPSPGYVNGTQVGPNIPVWLTDAASDETYTGTVNKTIY
jgi:hypothetical protein